MRRFLLLSVLVTMIGTMATAYADEPSTYQPDFCEFSVTFPSEPYKSRRCDEDNGNKCYDQISYTQVFGLDSTVNFRVICNPVNDDIKNNYSGDVMKATLRAMTDRSVVKTYNTSYREEDEYKQAGLVGEGQVGRTSTLYIAQLWIGDRSALSVEAELIGEPSDDADTLFSETMRSVHYVKSEENTNEGLSEDDQKEDASTQGE